MDFDNGVFIYALAITMCVMVESILFHFVVGAQLLPFCMAIIYSPIVQLIEKQCGFTIIVVAAL